MLGLVEQAASHHPVYLLKDLAQHAQLAHLKLSPADSVQPYSLEDISHPLGTVHRQGCLG